MKYIDTSALLIKDLGILIDSTAFRNTAPYK